MYAQMTVDYGEAEVEVTEKHGPHSYELYLMQDGNELSINFRTIEEMKSLVSFMLEKATELEVQAKGKVAWGK